ncbi:hypothetical protein NQ314_017893 [Rhamnusium bicolor]|uniref:Uncharacterized protein n=1 Tax=Rhamnusium bicolor TaxID=1586634 RepID=A0AAV8WSA6_9CUCU|nr:hypothetical protein NQ314_017893 [Rhamnusium bicolor]
MKFTKRPDSDSSLTNSGSGTSDLSSIEDEIPMEQNAIEEAVTSRGYEQANNNIPIEFVNILGGDPLNIPQGPEIHPHISARWMEIIKKGLGKEDRKQILEKYPLVKNCEALEAPILNREIEICMPDAIKKQDNFLSKLQLQLGYTLSSLAKPLNEMFTRPTEETNQHLEGLVNTGALLCDLHYAMSTHRRFALAPHINPSIKKSNRRDTF